MGTGRSGGVDNRLWSQRLRDRELDGTLRHRSGMAPKVRLAFAAVVLALVAIVVLVLGPLRRPLTSLFLPPTEEIQFVAALSGTADQSRDPSSLSDGSAESALNLPWQGSVAAPACGSPEAQTIRLEFDPARSPQLLRLYVGVDPVEEGVSPELFPGPRLISLRGEGECREPFDIGTQTGWVSLDVAEVAGQGGWIEIGVFSRWENSNVLTNDSVSIAEIELLE